MQSRPTYLYPNLSSVLSDPGRSRSEVASFFTRHWGEHFVPKTNIPLTAQLPKITDAHFLHYLSTTAKKHRQYLKARRALRKAISRHAEETSIDPEEVPTIFFSADFRFNNVYFFESVFLEPRPDEKDRLVSEHERKNADRKTPKLLSSSTRTDSLTSVQSLQGQTPVEAAGGRLFRPYKPLHNRLEWYMDTIGILLNHQLECKSEEFWRTVNSYSVLHGELEAAIEKARLVRKNLKITDQKIYEKSQKMVQLYHSKRNRELLLRKLNDIACLRDAQNTVQMLLNQNDFPKALECIETAQEVLNSDLKGVLCFRHLSNQLQELNKFIGKLLQEEFISLIQREFKKPIEKESESCYQEGQLHPVILGLLRCKEYRFITVLKSEIVEAVKNTVRQIVKGRIVECESNLADFDPSLGNLAEQITRMTLTQWVDTLSAVLRSLYLLCCRVMSIQELIIENLLFMEELRAKNRSASPKPPSLSANNNNNNGEQQLEDEFSESTSSAIQMLPRRTPSQASIHSVASALSLPIFASNHTAYDPDIHGPKGRYSKSEEVSLAAAEDSNDDGAETPTNEENPDRHLSPFGDRIIREEEKSMVSTRFSSATGNPSSSLNVKCFDFNQFKLVAPLLLEHTIVAAEERACKLIVARSKGGLLEKCSPETFKEVSEMVQSFVDQCRKISSNSTSTLKNESEERSTPSIQPVSVRSPLQSAMQQQTIKYLSKFHERKRQKLGNILDSEQWRQIDLPPIFQQLIDEYSRSGVLREVVQNTFSTDSEVEYVSSKASTCSNDTSVMTHNDYVVLGKEKFIVVGTALLLLRILAQYCSLLETFPQCVSELLLNVVEVLKSFNSRTCQLILGAGALQMVGLKTISVKHLALASRSLQLIAKFIPVIRKDFSNQLPIDKQNTLRYFDNILKDFTDHIDEIDNKLLMVIDNHLIGALTEWKVDDKGGEKTPTPAFQHIVKQIGKFYSGYSAIMPPNASTVGLFRRFEETGSNKNRIGQGRPRSARDDENVAAAAIAITAEPSTKFNSTRKLGKKMAISRDSAHRILVEDLGLKPYKMLSRQELGLAHIIKRLQRCRGMRRRFANGRHRNVVFTDEKIFTIEQAHNKQNDRVWMKELPAIEERLVTHEQHPQQRFASTEKCLSSSLIPTSVTIRRIIVRGSSGTQSSLGQKSSSVRNSGLFNRLSLLVPGFYEVCLVSGRCSDAYGNSHTGLAQKKFSELYRQNEWPPRSPDLNPLDFSIWSILEDRVCIKPHSNLESLKRALLVEWDKIEIDTVNKIAILHRIHANFKIYLKQHLQARGITPHNSLAYGMANQDFAYYVENMKAFPDCQSFPEDTLSELAFAKFHYSQSSSLRNRLFSGRNGRSSKASQLKMDNIVKISLFEMPKEIENSVTSNQKLTKAVEPLIKQLEFDPSTSEQRLISYSVIDLEDTSLADESTEKLENNSGEGQVAPAAVRPFKINKSASLQKWQDFERRTYPRTYEFPGFEASLPREWDWRDVNGVNYCSPTRNQHIPVYCGSCWVFGSLGALNDRFNVARKNKWPMTMLSPQEIIDCNGKGSCQGGEVGNVYDHAKNNGLVEEGCNNYKAVNGKCDQFTRCGTCWPDNCYGIQNYTRYYIKDYGKLAGRENMMSEIHNRGPIACSIGPLRSLICTTLAEFTKNMGIIRPTTSTGLCETLGEKLGNGRGDMLNLGIERDCYFADPDTSNLD
uniref:Vacuolar protein sorting-associated protein 54 n=1 Tax=Ditylenchus dipsaci TaxID=166011 RepID=A0A915D155_9BILA